MKTRNKIFTGIVMLLIALIVLLGGHFYDWVFNVAKPVLSTFVIVFLPYTWCLIGALLLISCIKTTE